MSSTRIVSTAKELKAALNDKIDNIIITDRKLGLCVQVVKKVTYTKLALVAGAAGVAAASFWSPLGPASAAIAGVSGFAAFSGAAVGVGAAGISGGTAAIAVAAIGIVGVLGLAAMVMHKDYAMTISTSAGGKVNGDKDKPKAGGNAAFNMTLKRNGT